MTPSLPPKLAPPGTPYTVALYLDHAAERLRSIAEKSALELKPYDIYPPDDETWGHHLFGTTWDRDYAIQVIAYEDGARAFKGFVIGFVMHLVEGKERWIELEYRQVLGMDGMAAQVRETQLMLRLACALRLPHIHEPDIKT